MQWGDDEDWLADQDWEEGEENPLDEKPELEPHLFWIWEAFWALAGDRRYDSHRKRPGPIPFVSLDAWARRYGIAGSEFDYLHTIIGQMDSVFLNWQPPALDTDDHGEP